MNDYESPYFSMKIIHVNSDCDFSMCVSCEIGQILFTWHIMILNNDSFFLIRSSSTTFCNALFTESSHSFCYI